MNILRDNYTAPHELIYPIRFHCKRCKSDMQADKEDVGWAKPNRFSGRKGFYYTACPLCKSVNKLTNVPK